jgi:predicted RNA-binding protein with RPS1 domain
MASYYLVNGSNAVAVVQSWSQAKRIEKYFKSVNFKGYDTYDEANADGLEHLSEITPYYIPLPDFLELGKVVSVSALNRNYQNKEEK